MYLVLMVWTAVLGADGSQQVHGKTEKYDERD